MELRVGVEGIICKAEISPIDDGSGDETMSVETWICGDVGLCENGVTIPLMSEEDRSLLGRYIGEAVMDFILEKTGYEVSNEDEA